MRWRTRVELPPETGQMRGRVVAWWHDTEDRDDRIAAFELLRPIEARIQRQLHPLGFYSSGPDTQEAVLRLRDRCQNHLHFEQVLGQWEQQMASSGHTLTQMISAWGIKN